MQQTKSYWRMLAVGGVVSAFVASACVVTTEDPTIDTAGSGGQATSSGGKATGGTSSGGTSSGGAGAATGGSTTGGSGGVPFQCDPPTEAGAAPVAEGTPLDCEPSTSPNACDKCVQTKCCAEYGACYATDPGNQCGWGGPLKYKGEANVGEFNCVTVCLQDAVSMSGTAPTDVDLQQCAADCATVLPGSAKNCEMSIGLQTNEAVTCQLDKCSTECFTP